jgi:hypothetical protein
VYFLGEKREKKKEKRSPQTTYPPPSHIALEGRGSGSVFNDTTKEQCGATYAA